MKTRQEILSTLDACCEASTFPMLDNGYVYLAATRLGAYRGLGNWAMTIEVFGFSPRSGAPDLQIYTMGSQLRNRQGPESFVDDEAYQRYLRVNPHSESDFVFPVAADGWQDSEDDEFVAENATHVSLRGKQVPIPSMAGLEERGISPEAPPRLRVFELCRFLAEVERESVLATDAERRRKVPENMTEVLLLDEWRHPDILAGELPSSTEAFVQAARVLESGETGDYQPTEPSNTHWRFWPEGGRL